jgi:hypothetical protein
MTPDSHRHLSTWAADPRCVVGDGKALAGARVHTIGGTCGTCPSQRRDGHDRRTNEGPGLAIIVERDAARLLTPYEQFGNHSIPFIPPLPSILTEPLLSR